MGGRHRADGGRGAGRRPCLPSRQREAGREADRETKGGRERKRERDREKRKVKNEKGCVVLKETRKSGLYRLEVGGLDGGREARGRAGAREIS